MVIGEDLVGEAVDEGGAMVAEGADDGAVALDHPMVAAVRVLVEAAMSHRVAVMVVVECGTTMTTLLGEAEEVAAKQEVDTVEEVVHFHKNHNRPNSRMETRALMHILSLKSIAFA